jgi:hypothetical protein
MNHVYSGFNSWFNCSLFIRNYFETSYPFLERKTMIQKLEVLSQDQHWGPDSNQFTDDELKFFCFITLLNVDIISNCYCYFMTLYSWYCLVANLDTNQSFRLQGNLPFHHSYCYYCYLHITVIYSSHNLAGLFVMTDFQRFYCCLAVRYSTANYSAKNNLAPPGSLHTDTFSAFPPFLSSLFTRLSHLLPSSFYAQAL